MLAALTISAALFFLVSAFCRRQGLFDAGSAGIGQFFAAVLYTLFWALPSLVMFIFVWVA